MRSQWRLADAEKAEQSAGDGAERDVRVGGGETAGRLTDLKSSARGKAAVCVQDVRAGAEEEAAEVGVVGPAESPGDSQ